MSPKSVKWRRKERIVCEQLSIERQELRAKLCELKHRKVIECHYCKQMLTMKEATLDHKHAKSKGGTNVLDNLVLCCYSCNQLKRDMPYEEFINHLKNAEKVPPKEIPKESANPKQKIEPTRLLPSTQDGQFYLLKVSLWTGEVLEKLGPFGESQCQTTISSPLSITIS